MWHAAIETTGNPTMVLRVSTRVKPGTLGSMEHLDSASE